MALLPAGHKKKRWPQKMKFIPLAVVTMTTVCFQGKTEMLSSLACNGQPDASELGWACLCLRRRIKPLSVALSLITPSCLLLATTRVQFSTSLFLSLSGSWRFPQPIRLISLLAAEKFLQCLQIVFNPDLRGRIFNTLLPSFLPSSSHASPKRRRLNDW